MKKPIISRYAKQAHSLHNIFKKKPVPRAKIKAKIMEDKKELLERISNLENQLKLINAAIFSFAFTALNEDQIKKFQKFMDKDTFA